MLGKALVLGGGGVVGIAWETGVLKGLSDGGVDPAAADLIIGTSAGSVVGTQIRAGRPLDDLYAAQLIPAGQGTADGLVQQPDLSALMQIFAKWGGATEMTPALMKEIGALAVSAKTPSEEMWVAGIGAALGVEEWPEGGLMVTAVDVADGNFVTWERGSGVELARAVATSCSVPGMFPPPTVNGHRYMDGGVRSGTSADLARGRAFALVIAPIGASAEGIGAIARRQIDVEIAGLQAGGTATELILPDAAATEAFGPNLMDPAHRRAAAEAGLRQGTEAAARLKEAWSGVGST